MTEQLGRGSGRRGHEVQLSHLPGLGFGASDSTSLSCSFLSWKNGDDSGNHPIRLFADRVKEMVKSVAYSMLIKSPLLFFAALVLSNFSVVCATGPEA